MVLVKKLKILHAFLFGKMGLENVFDDILETKQGFIDYNNKEFKELKNWAFSRGFGQKIENFPCLSFRDNRQGKCVSQYSRKNIFYRKKKSFSKLSKQGVKQIENS